MYFQEEMRTSFSFNHLLNHTLTVSVFVSQGRPTATGQCCTASSAGREATPTTSCGPNASAPLPVHAGETWFHWPGVQKQLWYIVCEMQRRALGALQPPWWQDVVCVDTHSCETTVNHTFVSLLTVCGRFNVRLTKGLRALSAGSRSERPRPALNRAESVPGKPLLLRLVRTLSDSFASGLTAASRWPSNWPVGAGNYISVSTP